MRDGAVNLSVVGAWSCATSPGRRNRGGFAGLPCSDGCSSAAFGSAIAAASMPLPLDVSTPALGVCAAAAAAAALRLARDRRQGDGRDGGSDERPASGATLAISPLRGVRPLVPSPRKLPNQPTSGASAPNGSRPAAGWRSRVNGVKTDMVNGRLIIPVVGGSGAQRRGGEVWCTAPSGPLRGPISPLQGEMKTTPSP